MALARKIPQRIAGIDFLNLIPKRAAIKAPVQAPVPGSGIPMKKEYLKIRIFVFLSLLPIALFSIFEP